MFSKTEFNIFIIADTFKQLILYECIMPKDSAVKRFEFVNKMYPNNRYICSTYGDMPIDIYIMEWFKLKSIFVGSSNLDLVFLYSPINILSLYESCIPKNASICTCSKVNDDTYDYRCGNLFSAIIKVFIV